MNQAQLAKALSANPEMLAMLAMMVGGNGKGRKTRSDKGFNKRAVASAETTNERKAALDAATVVAFTKAGFKDVKPRVNVLTYGKPADGDKPATGWIAQGRKVRKGEKAIKVKAPGMSGGIPLFHVSQTEPLEAVTATETTQTAS